MIGSDNAHLTREAHQLQEAVSRVRVLVVGDLMLDEYIKGRVSRISPEAPVPVVDISEREDVAGGAANVAANLSALGGQVKLVGVTGCDYAGERLLAILEATGVPGDSVIRLTNRSTTTKTRVVAGQHQIVRVDSESRQDLDISSARRVLETIMRLLPQVDACVLSDYGKGLLTEHVCANVIAEARSAGLPVIVDPKGTKYDKYAGCAWITPNTSELSAACNLPVDSESALVAAARSLLEKLPHSAVLVTRGADGMSLFRQGAHALHVHATARQVFNVVGAGDTAVAALALSLGAGLSDTVAVRIANLAAGIAVEKAGTATVSIAELVGRPESAGILGALESRLRRGTNYTADDLADAPVLS